ncbi:MAG: SDR family NAD(P)-dependent oxidoreductase [Acidobacteriota bacterium]|nr:SDR family NAD(P)-dependent oxidoreductase [Acidobacteriota bacterium]
MQSLKGQAALVTGSSQGIGAGIAKTLAANGARVLVHGLKEGSGAAVAGAIRDAGGEAFAFEGNLQDADFCRSLVAETILRFGRIDILVNNAGVVHRSNIENNTLELWDEVMAVNLRAPFILCQESVKDMKRRSSGCIINIGSVNAYIGGLKLLAYSSSKGGLMTFTKNLASYLTRYKIRVNQINPGWVLTEGEHYVESVVEGRGENWLEGALKSRPFGRMLLPADIAHAALFLATSDLVTGAVIDCEQMPVGALPEL